MTARRPDRKNSAAAGRSPTVTVTEADLRTAAQLSELFARQGGQGMRFVITGDSGASADLPPALVGVMETAAGILAGGGGVAVLARDHELTSQQAADMLNVSRQYMVRLLDRGDIPSIKVGTHRRVRAEDLAAYRLRRDAGRRAALDALADQAQADGGYDESAGFGPGRGAAV